MQFTRHLNLKMCLNYDLSLVSYVIKQFLSNLSTVMAPLYELLRKDTPWKCGKEQSNAFKQYKTLLHCDSLCERIHGDFAGPIKGQMYLIVIDIYSKWLGIIPIDSTTAEVTIRALREIISRWRLPLMMVNAWGSWNKRALRVSLQDNMTRSPS